MKKKAQVTIFIVIAIIIVVGALIFFLLRSDSETNTGLSGDESANVQRLIEDCSQKSLEKIIYLAGIGGGHVFFSENSNKLGIPYYYDKGEIYVVSKEELEEALILSAQQLSQIWLGV